jgi:hypothetical protein
MSNFVEQPSNTVPLGIARKATGSLLGSASGTGSITTVASYNVGPLIAKSWGLLLQPPQGGQATTVTIDALKTVDVVLSDVISGEKTSVIVFDAVKSEQFAQLFRDALKWSNVPPAKVETATETLRLVTELGVKILAL